MGGLLILGLIGLYVWGTKKLVHRVSGLTKKLGIILLAILIPTADAVYGRLKLKQMCDAEGGVHIYRTVENVKGFYEASYSPDGSDGNYLREMGYHFIEGRGERIPPYTELRYNTNRLSYQPDGSFLLEKNITPISEYVYAVTRSNRKDIYRRTEHKISVIKTGEILSSWIILYYSGGWFERFIGKIGDSGDSAGVSCQKLSEMQLFELFNKTLHPLHFNSLGEQK